MLPPDMDMLKMVPFIETFSGLENNDYYLKGRKEDQGAGEIN